MNNAFIRIYNENNGEEMLRYDLGEDFSIETAAVFGELYKNGNEWKFNAIGSGYQGGLALPAAALAWMWSRRKIRCQSVYKKDKRSA